MGARRREPARGDARPAREGVEPEDDAAIYVRHADELTRFATMLVGPSGAEDVVADAVVRVFRSRSWPRVTARRPYLFKAVYREAQMRHRSARRRLARELASSAGSRPRHTSRPPPGCSTATCSRRCGRSPFASAPQCS